MFCPIRQESPGDELFRILALASSDMSRFLLVGLSRLRTPFTGGFVVSRGRLAWPEDDCGFEGPLVQTRIVSSKAGAIIVGSPLVRSMTVSENRTWLMVKGVNVAKWNEKARLASS